MLADYLKRILEAKDPGTVLAAVIEFSLFSLPFLSAASAPLVQELLKATAEMLAKQTVEAIALVKNKAQVLLDR